MIPGSQCVMALVTAPDLESARKVARAALNDKQAACANLIPQIESHYWWEGKIEQSAEVLILFKTASEKVEGLQALVRANHPYQTPEFIVFPIAEGSSGYLAWIRQSVGRD